MLVSSQFILMLDILEVYLLLFMSVFVCVTELALC